jgi:hypothetical protein
MLIVKVKNVYTTHSGCLEGQLEESEFLALYCLPLCVCGSSEQFSFRRHFLLRHPALFYELIFFSSFFSFYLLHLHSCLKGKGRVGCESSTPDCL